MKMQKNWYLGFLGLIGFYELPSTIAYFSGEGDWYSLLGLLWFLWFLDFIPETKGQS